MLKYLYLFFLCISLFSKELIVNGSFETGDFTGWRIDQLNSFGSWYVYSGDTTPISSKTFLSPPSEAYAAISDETNPSSMVLYQDVTLPPHKKCVLTLIYYYLNFYDGFLNPQTLTDLDLTNPNQQLRIDLMSPSSDPFSVEPGDVLENLLSTPPGTPLVQGYTQLTADLSKYEGQKIRLRFACAANLYFLFFGIDNVSIKTLPRDDLVEAMNRFAPSKSQRGY